ncbi:MAG: ATP-dependent DNA helicase RecG [Sphingomonadaceae bacterium]|nr:ATP-dependent DNA helicase RecG [Sphingomonadaceae bacterium]
MRPAILNPLFAEMAARKGVGPGIARLLERLDIRRVRDLLFHLPSGFVERRAIADLDAARIGEQALVELCASEYRPGRSARAPMRISACDRAGNHVAIVYFGRAAHIGKRAFPLGEWRLVAGRIDRFGDDLQIVHPDHVGAVTGEGAPATKAHENIYPLTEGLTNPRIATLIADGLHSAPDLPEWADASLLANRGWPGWRRALVDVHGTARGEVDAAARDRLAYDELLAGQLAFLLVRAAGRQRPGRILRSDGRLRDAVPLPFALTGAQQRAIAEIDRDLAGGAPMLRLLQGDVGSGKTMVALMAMLAAAENGAQAAMLAPTEILARQHFANLSALLRDVPVRVALLTGREKGKARSELVDALARGDIHILIGTHAIFQDAVVYDDLALIIVDEQHKFGVAQRMALARKGRQVPHVLAMTATPIPRTLVLAAYGELDESRLDELPPGRSPVDTRVVVQERIGDMVDALARHMEAGGRAYWVCPLVNDSDKSAATAVEARFAALQTRFGDRVAMVHGQMASADRDAAMQAFASGAVQLLVATTVIEVGVDVPEASLMIIENAEFFGLAQLHQLRGRVGRGSAASRCILLRANAVSETARARLTLMRETQDGFRIAEEDLRLRGGGELMGTRQSGEGQFHLASSEQIDRLIGVARDDAHILLERDGGLDGARGDAARILLYLFERDVGVQLLRGG